MTNKPATSRSNPSQNSGDITVVLFDMGGVLVELGTLTELFASVDDEARLWPRWLKSPAVQRFERGLCSPEEFAGDAVADLELTISAETFLDNFIRLPRGLYPGAQELVAELTGRVEVGVLSNTNELHWDSQPDAQILQTLVSRPYLSYRLGEVKPDAAVFRLVLDDLAQPPHQVLFLDDNQINVDAARRLGINAETVKGPDAARQALVGYGVL